MHFQDVLERYSPYETLLDITTGEGLNDTALAGSFHLHTASPSPSANRLDEIREDGEDSGPPLDMPSSANASSSNLLPGPRPKADRRSEYLRRKSERPERLSSLNATAMELPRGGALNSHPPSAPASQKPSMSQFLVREESGRTSITQLKPPFVESSAHEHRDSDISTKSADSTRKTSDVPDSASQTTQDAGEITDATEVQSSPEQPPKPARDESAHQLDPRDRELPPAPVHPPPPPPKELEKVERSTQRTEQRASRTDPAGAENADFDWKEYYDSMFTPKRKLAPRPVAAAETTKRPATARVSAMPPHYRPMSKRQEQSRTKSFAQEKPTPPPPISMPSTMSAPVLAPPPIPLEPEYESRPVSRGSIKSTTSHKTMMTPDKLRLMKAVELRKRQMRKSQGQQHAKAAVEEAPKIPHVPESKEDEPSEVAKNPDLERVLDEETQPQSAKADSGIEMQDSNQPGSVEPVDQSKEQEMSTDVPQPAQQDQTGGPAEVAPSEPSEPDQAAGHERTEASEDMQSEATQASEAAQPEERSVTKEDAESEPTVPQIVLADASRPVSTTEQTRERQPSPSRASSERPVSEAPSSNGTVGVPDSIGGQNSDLAKRRCGYVEPLQLEMNSGNPDDFVSDDEDFLEELHSAEVQEAKPITVSRSSNTRSPTSPVGDRRPSADTASVRSINIIRANTVSVEKATTIDHRITPETYSPSRPATTPPIEVSDPMSSYARNVSSGISRRIQALAEMSSREGGHSDHSGRSTPRSRPTSYRRHSSNRAMQATAGASSEAAQNSSTWVVQHDPVTNRNSVSVTARIVRPTTGDDATPDEASLQQSELTINHKRNSNAGEISSSANTSKANSVGSSPAISPVVPRFSQEARTMHSASATRLGRHRQGSTPGLDEFPPPPSSRGIPNSGKSSLSGASNDENAPPKEGGRTSRFFKRMSNFGGPKRKSGNQSGASTTSLTSIASNETSKPQQPATQRQSVASEKADAPPPVVVGDLNVQFPDSLVSEFESLM